ncbi:VOC family protein [Allorhizocola rhizosphaerae]|uniref:VOC family protein n=1 Tax=Allorhizocola rhizosphaerae TaxID=1872709 RepID=UPI000E3C3A2D|nr:VOC family protein [Allorhizocola rhizosphaerae]
MTTTASWPGTPRAITLFVADLATAKHFYQRAFGRPATYEDDHSAVYTLGATMINLLHRSQAPALIAPATAGTNPTFVLTLAVDDVDTTCAELAAAGITPLNGPMDRPWGIRTASFQDPDGHIWEIAR